MVKIQLELTEDENYIVDMYKVVNRLVSKQQAIKKIILESKRK